MNYPGRLIHAGEADKAIVNAIQKALDGLGYGPFTPDSFDANMTSTLRLFQSQHSDREGRPLAPDGVVGPMTWAVLFGATASPPQTQTAPGPVAQAALAKARAEIGVAEDPLGSNSGPRVDQYLSSVGIAPGVGKSSQRYWCMAFAYFCVNAAATDLGVANPLARTAGVIEQWNLCATRPHAKRISRHDAMQDYSLVQPGQILILNHGGGSGHTGIISGVDGSHLSVIEGNASGKPHDSNGLRVMETTFRTIADPEVTGFISIG